MINLATFICMCKKLEFLSLKGCGLDDESINLICDRLFTFPHLVKFDLSENRITDVSVEKGIGSLMNPELPPHLTDINLAHNSVTSEGAKELFE